MRVHTEKDYTPCCQQIGEFGSICENLSWFTHITQVVSKAYKTLGLIWGSFDSSTPIHAKNHLYLSLVQSQLSYCCTIWCPHLLKDIENVQCRATKWILNDYTSDYKSRLIELHMLPLMANIIHVSICVMQFFVQWGFAIGSFLSQHKQPHFLYERTKRFWVIHVNVVKCVACKNACGWAYTITVLLGLQGNIEKSLCTFMHNNAKKLQRKFQHYCTKNNWENWHKQLKTCTRLCVSLITCTLWLAINLVVMMACCYMCRSKVK